MKKRKHAIKGMLFVFLMNSFALSSCGQEKELYGNQMGNIMNEGLAVQYEDKAYVQESRSLFEMFLDRISCNVSK